MGGLFVCFVDRVMLQRTVELTVIQFDPNEDGGDVRITLMRDLKLRMRESPMLMWVLSAAAPSRRRHGENP